MKQLYEIGNTHELEQTRGQLLRRLHKQEKQVDKDMQRISNHWQRWKTLGSSVSNLALSLMPKVNTLSLGFGLIRRLLKRKK